MCGICGIINFNNSPVENGQINKMMQTMKHRGPNDEGSCTLKKMLGLDLYDLVYLIYQFLVTNQCLMILDGL